MRRHDGFDEAQMTPDARQALEKAGLSRRGFIRNIGAMVVGFSAAGSAVKSLAQSTGPVPAAVVDTAQVDSWVAIAADGTVTGYSGKCEFGQGFSTVQYQLIADELYVPLDRVKLIYCDTNITPDQGVTSGSQSHPAEFGTAGLRQALATAREAMFQMASTRLNVPVGDLKVEDGVISSKTDATKAVSYAALVNGQKFRLTLNANAKVKDPNTYTVLGKSVPRYDIPAKATGRFQYIQNVRMPGMLHGKVVRPPSVGAKFVSVDESSIRGLPGNVKVVTKGDFVGVVADKEWQALQAAQQLVVNWSGGGNLPAHATLYDWMKRQPTRDAFSVRASDVDQKLSSAAKTISATYLHPYQMHGSMGTSCAVADIKGSGSTGFGTIYSATQGVYPQRDSVALVLGIPKENIRVVFVEGSGCYGINGNDTVSYDAALLSQAVGKPVRLQYTRSDEMTGAEHYGPAFIVNLKAGVDANGSLTAWDYEGWTLSKGGRPNATTPGNIPTGALVGFATPAVVPTTTPTVAATYSNNNNSDSSYSAGCVGTACGGTGTLQSVRVLTHTIQSPFFTGPLRSPNRLQNTFANESFIDEVAAAVKADPVEYRLRHLSDIRLKDCVTGAAKAAGWDPRPSPKVGQLKTGWVTGRGIACVLYEGDNGYCALVAEVAVNQDTGDIIVNRFFASQDSGPVSNPDGIRNQMEGGVLQGMSRALHEEVVWDDLGVTSNDWRKFPVFRFGEFLPVMENVVIDRKDVVQMGAGECTITVAAAAIGNAVFDATGARLRRVPFTPANVLAALKARS